VEAGSLSTHAVLTAVSQIGTTVSQSAIELRQAFVRKVYGVLSIQILSTAVVGWIMSGDRVVDWTRTHPGLMLIPMFGAILAMLGVYWKRRSSPANVILLGLFTVLEAITVGSVISFYNSTVVLQAAAATAFVFIGLTIFTIQCELLRFPYSQSPPPFRWKLTRSFERSEIRLFELGNLPLRRPPRVLLHRHRRHLPPLLEDDGHGYGRIWSAVRSFLSPFLPCSATYTVHFAVCSRATSSSTPTSSSTACTSTTGFWRVSACTSSAFSPFPSTIFPTDLSPFPQRPQSLPPDPPSPLGCSGALNGRVVAFESPCPLSSSMRMSPSSSVPILLPLLPFVRLSFSSFLSFTPISAPFCACAFFAFFSSSQVQSRFSPLFPWSLLAR
jgi:hypothetical protein